MVLGTPCESVSSTYRGLGTMDTEVLREIAPISARGPRFDFQLHELSFQGSRCAGSEVVQGGTRLWYLEQLTKV